MNMSPAESDELQQRIEWRNRLLQAIIRREFDDATIAEMIEDGLHQAHTEGLTDAADICRDVAKGSPSSRHVATVLDKAIRELAERNKRSLEMAREIIPLEGKIYP